MIIMAQVAGSGTTAARPPRRSCPSATSWLVLKSMLVINCAVGRDEVEELVVGDPIEELAERISIRVNTAQGDAPGLRRAAAVRNVDVDLGGREG